MIDLALAEDLGEAGDITTRAIFKSGPPKTGAAIVLAKSAGVLSGLKIFARVFAKIDALVQVDFFGARPGKDFSETADRFLARPAGVYSRW